MKRYFGVMFMLGMAALIFPSGGICDEVIYREITDGPDVVMDIHPGSPAVCFAVSIGAGSVLEAPEISGITHFIEHMAFDGSERFSRSEISEWVDNNGVFLNAFTRRENTVFFTLVRRELAGEAVEILSEMLLHSVFPGSEIKKERNIILEEIRKTLDNPGHAGSRLVERYLYAGSRLAHPVLGYPETIAGICRSDLITYYRKYYTPSNMTVFVMGGINPDRAVGLIKSYFRRTDRSDRGQIGEKQGFSPHWSNRVTVRSDPDLSRSLDFLIRIRGGRSRICRVAAATVLSSIISDDNFPFRDRLDELGVTTPEISINMHRGFCAMRLSFRGGIDSVDNIEDVTRILRDLSEWKPCPERIRSAVNAYLSSDLFDREKYHYYIMLHGEMMATLGEKYFSEYLEEIAEISGDDIRSILEESFSAMEYNGCLIRKERDINFSRKKGPEIETVPGGARIASVTRQGSDVAALNILVGGRNCLGEGDTAGMTVILHRMLEIAAEENGLAEQLERLGARITWGDNPYIPMDDYLLNPSFSWMGLETPISSFEEVSKLFIEHIRSAELTEERLKRGLGRLRRETMIRGNSPMFRLKKFFNRKLLGGHPYGDSVFPGQKPDPDLSDISSFREVYLGGDRLIATLVSGFAAGEASRLLSELSGKNIKAGSKGRSVCPPFPDQTGTGRFRIPGQGEGAYLLAGFGSSQESGIETAAVAVAAEILDRRLQNEIRERRGLAYSTGCSFKLMKGGFTVQIYLGTRSVNLNEASEALMEEISGLGAVRPDRKEVEVAISRICSGRSRRELSSINEAYSVGMDLFCFSDGLFVNSVMDVSVEQVRRVIKNRFVPDNILFCEMVPENDGLKRKQTAE